MAAATVPALLLIGRRNDVGAGLKRVLHEERSSDRDAKSLN
jgi:hypothetical protein